MKDPNQSQEISIKETPPTATRVAVILLIISMGYGAVAAVRMVNWQAGAAFAIILVIVSIVVYFLRTLYRGRNGARLALVIAVLISLLGSYLNGPPSTSAWEQIRFWFQNVANTNAAILVCLPTSNAWFRRHKPPKQFRERTPMDY